MKIHFIGTILGTSGYDAHCRGLVNALYKLNPDIRLDIPLPENWVRNVNDEEYKMITNENRVADITIMVATPPYWRVGMGDNTKHFVGFLVWEGDKIPVYWLEYLLDNRISQIWVPSQHTKDAILKTYNDYGNEVFEFTKLGVKYVCSLVEIEKKIKIVPHGINPDLFKPQDVKRDKKFTFVCCKGWRGTSWDRGGVQYLLKAYCEEFKKEEDICLLLKTNPSYLHPSQLKQALDSLNLPQERPEIKLIPTDIPYNQLLDLYNMGDVFVCSTRAEGFNLPGLEAMACEKSTIQTNFGGQTDYMTKENSLYIDFVVEQVKEDIMYEGISWATPIIESIRKNLRYAYEHQEEMKQKGKQALLDSQNWTWDKSAEKAMNFLSEFH